MLSEIMNYRRFSGPIALGTLLAAIFVAGCDRSADQATHVPQTLEQERIAVHGSKPPADAGAKYLAAQGSDPAAIRARIDSAGVAYQNRKK